jgi:radical SAM superfamily enzyme YgiQ (UPF0313 family)
MKDEPLQIAPFPKKRVIFVHCVNRRFSDTQMFGVHFMPVWAYTLAAHLQDIEGLQFSLFDARFEEDSDLPNGDIYLFTGINQDKEAILELQKFVRRKKPEATLVLGGPICWSLDTAGKIEDLLGFDHLIIGDGEKTVVEFFRKWQEGAPLPKLIRTGERFDLSQARLMHRPLLQETLHRYYGGVLEVSRGCPFLCEFCDIRIQPDNNRSHVKPPALLIEEVEFMANAGVKQLLFACDNFIGNPGWAEEVCDRLIEWRKQSGKSISLYTWLTINVNRTPRLLKKLRLAGFDMFFIGVESFNQSSLQETAKVQNTTLELVDTLREIQSYGIIVVAGLIFGFDTDPDDIVKITLDGILESGLISGDPSLLTALPGTPLYKRMRLSGRLREAKLGLGGFKYQTNIRYLKPVPKIRAEFRDFVQQFNTSQYQRKRLLSFYRCLTAEHFIATNAQGYSNLGKLFGQVIKEPKFFLLFAQRIWRLIRSPSRLLTILGLFIYTFTYSSKTRPLFPYFKFWLFNWSNSLLKYGDLKDEDFDIESAGENFDPEKLIPAGYEIADEPIPLSKIKAQRDLTMKSLEKVKARLKGES